MRYPRASRMSLPFLIAFLILSAEQLPAQNEPPPPAELIARVIAGDQAARKALTPIARRMVVDWNGRHRTLASAKALADVMLAMAHPITPIDQQPRENEVDWRAPAVRVLRYLVAQDSGDVSNLSRLTHIAPYPYIWTTPEQELAHLRAAAVRHPVLPMTLARARVGLELELGHPDAAESALQQIPADSLSGTEWSHLAASIAFGRGASTEGLRRYQEGAQQIRTASDAEMYFTDVAWIASAEDSASWAAVPLEPGAHTAWLEAFWEAHDLVDGRLPGTRLTEQFARFQLALREYRWDLDGQVAEGRPHQAGAALEEGFGDVTFPVDAEAGRQVYDNTYTPSGYLLDDRGLIVMRHGLPSRSLRSPGAAGRWGETLIWVRASGPMMLSFSHPTNVMGDPVAGLGMLARNRPTTDLMTLCQANAQFCTLAGQVAAGGGSAIRRGVVMLQRYTATRIDAQSSQGNPARFEKQMPAILQAYGVAGGGVLVVAAIPIKSLPKTSGVDGGMAYAGRISVVIGDPASGRVLASLDTVRRWRFQREPDSDAFLTATWTLPSAPGSYAVSMIAGDTLQKAGAGVRVDAVPVIALDGKALRLSDPILGRRSSGMTWRHDGVDISLNPTNAWSRKDEAPLSYELDGLVVGRSYQMEVEIWEADGKPKSPRTSVRFAIRAGAVHQRGEQVISFQEVRSGDYRMVLRVRDPVSGAMVERSRMVAVR